MKVAGIVGRIDGSGRVVIPKEIRRAMRICEGNLSLMMLTWEGRLVDVGRFAGAVVGVGGEMQIEYGIKNRLK